MNFYKKLLKYTVVFGLIASTGLLLASCSSKKATTNSNTITAPTRVSTKGSFVIGKNGVLKNTAKTNNKPIVDIYLDPLCPSCGFFDRQTSPFLSKKLKEGKILLRYHPLMFLDQGSTDEYSTRGSAFLMGVAEFAPKLTQKYVSAMYEKSFQPSEGPKYKATSNAKLTNLFYGVGGTKTQAQSIHKYMKYFGELSYNTTRNVIKDKSLIKKSPTGELYTPYVLINKAGQNSAHALVLTPNMKPDTEKAVNNVIK